MARNQVLGACIARGTRAGARLVGGVAVDLRRRAAHAVDHHLQPLLRPGGASMEARRVVEVGDLTARDEWAAGRAALDSFLVDLGGEGVLHTLTESPARWTVGETTTEVDLVYGIPVISITSGDGPEVVSIVGATRERLRSAHVRAGRAVRLA